MEGAANQNAGGKHSKGSRKGAGKDAPKPAPQANAAVAPPPAKPMEETEPVAVELGCPRVRQWSLGEPVVVKVEAIKTLATDVRSVKFTMPKLRVGANVEGLSRLRLLTKLVCSSSGRRRKPVALEGLLLALHGHPSLSWLDVSGNILDWASHYEVPPVGSAALRKLLQTAPKLTCLRLDDGCIDSPFGLVHLLESVKTSNLAKVSVLRTIEFFSEADLEYRWEGRTPLSHLVLKGLIEALLNPQLVEFSFCPDLQFRLAPEDFVFQAAELAHNFVRESKVAYFAPLFRLNTTLDASHAMVELMNRNARRWAPERHGCFPWAFHQATNQLLLLANRFGIPREVVHMILGFLARHFPIVPIAVDELNHELPFERQMQLSEYLARIDFPQQ